MFSVGAAPFNSPSRMRYGGWALSEGFKADSPISGDPATDWRNYMALKMQGMYDYNYATTPAIRQSARQTARDINAYYTTLGRINKGDPRYVGWKRIKQAWVPLRSRTGLSQGTKTIMYNDYFTPMGFTGTPSDVDRARLAGLRFAPFRAQPSAASIGNVPATINSYWSEGPVVPIERRMVARPSGISEAVWRDAVERQGLRMADDVAVIQAADAAAIAAADAARLAGAPPPAQRVAANGARQGVLANANADGMQ